MATDFEREYRQRRAGFRGFIVFLALAAAGVVIALALLAYFVL